MVRGDVPVRPMPLFLGIAALIPVWALPLDAMLGPFPAHMLRHMALVALIPPLLVAGLPRLAAPPILIAAVVEFAVIWAWHAPALHEAAWFSSPVFALEQASFLAAGILTWASAMNAREPLAGAGGMLLTSMHMTLLGALLILSPTALYSYCGPEAQQVGGMLMLAIGTPAYLAAGLWFTARALGRDGEAAA